MLNQYKTHLKNILQYATDNNSWSKQLLTKNADIVCAYGLGKYFSDAFTQWKFKSMFNVSYCSDKDEEHGKKIANANGLTFLSIDKLLSIAKTKNVVVILFVGDAEVLRKYFTENGVYVISPDDCIFEELCNMPSNAEWFAHNKLLDAFDFLSDEESQRTYVNLLAQRMALPFAKFSYSELFAEGEYFGQSFMPLSSNEVFVDCGAYNGDSMEGFLKATNGECNYIYAYEMAKDNFDELKKTASKLTQIYPNFSAANYSLINAGVWNCREKLSYGKENAGTGESYGVFKTDNIMYADAVTLDETVDKEATFIKMDIEGAEVNAIGGGVHLIKNNKPKLAICVYHRLQDFWEVPTLICEIVSDYKIYIRHH